MRIKINIMLLVFLMTAMGLVYYSCDNPANSDPLYPGYITGWVYEDSTRIPLPGVKVWADGIKDTLYTSDSGKFQYTKISMPRGEMNFYLRFSKTGYINDTVLVYVKSDIESKIDSVFLNRSN